MMPPWLKFILGQYNHSKVHTLCAQCFFFHLTPPEVLCIRQVHQEVGVFSLAMLAIRQLELDLMMIKSSSLFLSQPKPLSSVLSIQCYINIVSAMGVFETVRTPPPLPSWVSINSGPCVKW